MNFDILIASYIKCRLILLHNHFFENTNRYIPISGFFWRELMTETGAEPEAWKFLAVCVPIVVFFAPFGSIIASHFHRQVLAWLIYILDTIALVIKYLLN